MLCVPSLITHPQTFGINNSPFLYLNVAHFDPPYPPFPPRPPTLP